MTSHTGAHRIDQADPGAGLTLRLPPLGRILSVLMHVRGVNSVALAARMTGLGVPTSSSLIREYSRGRRLTEPRRETLAAMAVALEVPIALFFDATELDRFTLAQDADPLAGPGSG